MTARRTIAIAVGAGLLAASVTLWAWPRRPTPPLRFETAFYVWQSAWGPTVSEAVQQAAPRADGFMVLAGEVDGRGAVLSLRPANVDWSALAATNEVVTPVLRANSGLQGRDPEAAAQFLNAAMLRSLRQAKAAGLRVAEVQLDYDCPTSALGEFRDILRALRKSMPGFRLSITALPTWLDDRDFRRLAREADYYVLQVHGLERPTTVDAPVVLFDAGKVPGWLKQASRVGVPFQVALPTYGYRVAFDRDGKFVGLAAESSSPAPNGRTVIVDPAEVATVVSQLKKSPPPWCAGIAWFRLPVEGDTLNWSWPTLESVMAGEAPETLPSVEVRRPRNDLFELWINNTSGYSESLRVRLTLHWNNATLRTYDALGGFEANPDRAAHTVVVTGPAPEGRDAAMVAWFVVEPGEQAAFSINGVEWVP